MRAGWILKAAVLWAVLIVASMVAAMPFHWDIAPLGKDEPWPIFPGLIMASGVGAFVLAMLAERAGWRGWKLGLAMACVFFIVENGQSEIEAVAFNNDLKIPTFMLINGTLSNLLRDLIACGALALLWRKGESRERPALTGLWWKPAVTAVLYFACYTVAGLWAYAQPAAHAFYAHVSQITLGFLSALELGRGLVWCIPVYLLARGLRGPAWSVAALTGVAFSLLMIDQLLLPNSYMAWPVRCVHIIEVGTSNLVFGFLASLLWVSGSTARSSADRP